jgi:hypothetical protein
VPRLHYFLIFKIRALDIGTLYASTPAKWKNI